MIFMLLDLRVLNTIIRKFSFIKMFVLLSIYSFAYMMWNLPWILSLFVYSRTCKGCVWAQVPHQVVWDTLCGLYRVLGTLTLWSIFLGWVLPKSVTESFGDIIFSCENISFLILVVWWINAHLNLDKFLADYCFEHSNITFLPLV